MVGAAAKAMLTVKLNFKSLSKAKANQT